MAAVQSWAYSRSGRVAWTAPLHFKSLIPKKRDQRGRGLTFTKNRWTHSHTCCFSHTRTMPLQSKHNICSSQKPRHCQKHVQNKIAWRHQSKKEIKEKKDMRKAKQESLYFHLIFCFFLWPVPLFSTQHSPELKALVLSFFFYCRWYNHMNFESC